MKRLLRTSAVLVFAGAALVAACSKKPAPQTTPEPTPAPVATAPTPVDVATPPRPQPTPAVASVISEPLTKLSGYLNPVFFDLDRAEIRPDAKDVLGANAEFLRKYPTLRVTIEGHCDERGTREYNMALGQRRSSAAKEYLSSLGIDASRLTIVSYGKERPFCAQRSEDCWQKNRRAHFVVTAK